MRVFVVTGVDKHLPFVDALVAFPLSREPTVAERQS